MGPEVISLDLFSVAFVCKFSSLSALHSSWQDMVCVRHFPVVVS